MIGDVCLMHKPGTCDKAIYRIRQKRKASYNRAYIYKRAWKSLLQNQSLMDTMLFNEKDNKRDE